MNCAQIHRSVLTDPHRLSEEVQTHLTHCTACQFFYQGQLKQQSQIASTVARTPAPGLRPLVIPMPDAANGALARPSRRRFFAAAASVSMATTGALSAGLWWRQPSVAPDAKHWALVVVKDFQEDPTYRLPPDPNAPAHAQAILKRLGARQLAALPTVIQGGLCQLLDCEAAHLVLLWKNQPVVVYLMPRKGQAVLPLSVGGWHGELRPLVGGMVATLAQNPSIAQSLAQHLTSIIAWRA